MAANQQRTKTFCVKGQRDCKQFELNGQCEGDCPIIDREQKLAVEGNLPIVKKSLAELYQEQGEVDMPFELEDLVAMTSPEYDVNMTKPELSIYRFNTLMSMDTNKSRN
jgi:hypothetical protein